MRNAPFYFLALMLAMALAWIPSVPSGEQYGQARRTALRAATNMKIDQNRRMSGDQPLPKEDTWANREKPTSATSAARWSR